MLRLHKNVCRFIYGLSHHQFLLCKRSSSSYQYNNQRNHGDKENFRKKDGNEEPQMYFYKSRGQHILTNPRILDSIVRKSAVEPTDTVLEIGPGTGNLTLKLLEASQKVVAIEIDKRMVEVLNKRVAEHKFEDRICVIREDALKCEFPRFDLVVANIPYGISSPLVVKLVYGAIPFRSATLLLQKEFAARLLANPGESEYNRLAVNVKLVADVEHVMDVSKRDFVPSPKVDSSVVIIRPKKEVPEVNREEWLAFTRTCFGKKNKTLGATFKQKRKLMDLMHSNSGRVEEEKGFDSFKKKIVEVLKCGEFEDKRPAKLCNEELLRLLALFNQAGIYFHDGSELQDAERRALADAYSFHAPRLMSRDIPSDPTTFGCQENPSRVSLPPLFRSVPPQPPSYRLCNRFSTLLVTDMGLGILRSIVRPLTRTLRSYPSTSLTPSPFAFTSLQLPSTASVAPKAPWFPIANRLHSLTETRFPKRRPGFKPRRKRASLRPPGPYAWVKYTPGEPIQPNQPNEGSVKHRNEKKRIRLHRAFVMSEKKKRKAQVQEAKKKKLIQRVERKMAAVARERAWAQRLAELQQLEKEKNKSMQ